MEREKDAAVKENKEGTTQEETACVGTYCEAFLIQHVEE